MTHSRLIARLEQLTAPDREVDARIQAHLYPDQKYMTFGGDVRTNQPAEYDVIGNFPFDEWEGDKSVDFKAIADMFYADPYTASVDAALALAEKVLPGCEYEITTLYNIARVTIHAGDVGPFYGTDECCNVPNALCIAILKAHGAGK